MGEGVDTELFRTGFAAALRRPARPLARGLTASGQPRVVTGPIALESKIGAAGLYPRPRLVRHR